MPENVYRLQVEDCVVVSEGENCFQLGDSIVGAEGEIRLQLEDNIALPEDATC